MSSFTTPDGCRLYFNLTGPESPRGTLIFLNGLCQTALYWFAHAKHFDGQYRVLCYDARAQGKSDTGTAPLTPRRHARDLSGLMDHLQIPRATLVGLSHGAYVACAFASAAPRRSAGLVLSGAALAPSTGRRALLEKWQRVLGDKGLKALGEEFTASVFGPAFMDRYRHLIPVMGKTASRRNNPEAVAAQLAALFHYPPLSAFAGDIRTPSMVLWGDHDKLVEREGARSLARRLGATWVPMAGIGHSLPVEAPDAFQQHLSDFLTRHDL